MTPRALRCVAAAWLATMMAAAPAAAEQVRLQRVLLLPSPDRSSVVLELDAAPRHVSTRRLSDSVLEVEAGPGVISVAPRVLKAPAHVRFVDSVTVRVLETAAGPVVRARIALSTSAQAVLRSSGRRVYVDISPLPAALPQPSQAPVRAAAVPGSGARPAPPPGVGAEDAYRAAVRSPIEKLKELGPFLASAAVDPGVGVAILPTLSSVRASMMALQPPDAEQGSHAMVLGAVERITRALAPDFAGDRAAAVRQSMTTIEIVGGVLVNPEAK